LQCDGRLHPLEGGHALIQLYVQIHRAGNAAHRRRAKPVLAHGAFGGSQQARMVGETEIIVGAEVEHALAINLQPGTLRRPQGADVVVQACITQGL